MKRIAVFFLALCLLLSGCAAPEAPVTEPPTEPATEPQQLTADQISAAALSATGLSVDNAVVTRNELAGGTVPYYEVTIQAEDYIHHLTLDAYSGLVLFRYKEMTAATAAAKLLEQLELTAEQATFSRTEYVDLEGVPAYEFDFETYDYIYNFTVHSVSGKVLKQKEEKIIHFRHPLTGAPLDTPWTGRATAVVVNNIKSAMPQHGIGSADIVYELETEGGITRHLAIFSDLENVADIGPVRSVRTFFSCIALSYDAPIIHCGGSDRGYAGYYDYSGSKISGWAHINEQYNSRYFYRNTERRKAGYAYEHTLFTTGEKLLKGLADKKYVKTTEGGTNYSLQFSEDVKLGGKMAYEMTVNFRGGTKTTSFKYDLASGLYSAFQYGSPHVDGNTGDQLTYKNVLVLVTDQWKARDSHYSRSYYELFGTGKGYFACNGKIVPIKWHRSALRGNFTYTLEDGTPITLGVGRTYVAIVEHATPVVYR